MTAAFPAIIAASGLSTRMGRSKALLDAEGITFLARILDTFRRGGADPILVVVRDTDGPEAGEARAHGGLPVANPDPSPGPISSLQAGILTLPEGVAGALYSPVDHPLFGPDTVRALIHEFRKNHPPMVAPEYHGRRGHPVLFSQLLFRELLEPDLPEGARTVVGRYFEERSVIPVEDPGILADIDTPEDYKRLLP